MEQNETEFTQEIQAKCSQQFTADRPMTNWSGQMKSIVVVPKENQIGQLCGDHKVTLSQAVDNKQNLIPNTRNI